jgi:hypothetical protein
LGGRPSRTGGGSIRSFFERLAIYAGGARHEPPRLRPELLRAPRDLRREVRPSRTSACKSSEASASISRSTSAGSPGTKPRRVGCFCERPRSTSRGSLVREPPLLLRRELLRAPRGLRREVRPSRASPSPSRASASASRSTSRGSPGTNPRRVVFWNVRDLRREVRHEPASSSVGQRPSRSCAVVANLRVASVAQEPRGLRRVRHP